MYKYKIINIVKCFMGKEWDSMKENNRKWYTLKGKFRGDLSKYHLCCPLPVTLILHGIVYVIRANKCRTFWGHLSKKYIYIYLQLRDSSWKRSVLDHLGGWANIWYMRKLHEQRKRERKQSMSKKQVVNCS